MKFVMMSAAASMLAMSTFAKAADEKLTIAVFPKNSTNPAYESFRIGAEKVGRWLVARIVHFVPKKPDNVDEQKAMVEQVLKDRPDVVIFIPVDDVAMVEFGQETQRRQYSSRRGGQYSARPFRDIHRRR